MKTWLLPIAFCAAMQASSVPVGHYPNTSNGSVLYGALGSAPSDLWPGIYSWMNQRFDWVLGGPGNNVYSSGPATVSWATYTDMAFVYANQMYSVQATAAPNGLILEDVMLHQSIDMQYPSAYQWSAAASTTVWGPGKFDGFEAVAAGDNWSGAEYGGVFTYNGTTWSDCTYCAFKGAITGCLPPSTTYYGNPTVGGTLYVGYMEPFDQINFGALQHGRAGGSVAFNYWNGSSWTALANHFSDGTSGLSTAGAVHFYPPSDWAARPLKTATAHNNEHSKYWVQIVVTGATVSPVFGTIYGDDWTVASGSNNSRGWSTTDPNRVNIGTRLEYNPTPPANASARFRYQARVTGIWAPNAMLGNPSNIQNGVRAWGRYLTDQVDASIAAGANFNAAFFDDAAGLPTVTSPANAAQYFDYNQSSWSKEWQATYLEMLARLKLEHGADFQVGLNGAPWSMASLGDFELIEGWWLQTWSPSPTFTTTGSAPFDEALPVNNPNGAKLLVQCSDWSAATTPWSQFSGIGMGSWHYADHANRTPLMCLAMQYLGSNPNTAFLYNGGSGGYYYVNTDQVLTFSLPTVIVSDVTADLSTNVKAVNLGSVTGCAPPTPDYSNIVVQIGTPSQGDVVSGTLNGKTLSTTSRIYNSYPSGTAAYCVQAQHLSTIASPLIEDVFAWTHWFPAMGVDIGAPDPKGLNGGARMIPWKAGGAPDYISGQARSACSPANKCADLWRRDFTKGIVLFRPWSAQNVESELDTPSQAIALGATYYPLKADGTTGPGVTSLTLRGGEGAILMLSSDSAAPLAITGPASLPAGAVGVAYPATSMSATGGTGTYKWSASGLPPGVSINSGTGVIPGHGR